MNCDELREDLIELVYDELDRPRRNAALEHLRACPACRDEYARLRLGRAAVAHHRAGEPTAATIREWAAGLGAVGGRLRSRRLWAAVGGIAATAAVLMAVWLLHGPGTPPAFAEPVEIRKVGVSLTILSEPEDTGGYRYGRGQQRMFQTQQKLQPPGQVTFQMVQIGAPQLSSQVFQTQIERPWYRGWQGLALVRDQRVVRNLNRGATQVRFQDVPSGIRPDTVRLRCPDDGGAMKILEQNYQYDLASAGAVLKRYLDRTVTVTFKAGGQLSGRLLSFDGAALVLQPDGAGPRSVARQQVKDIRFAKLPEGLLTTPTLVWRLETQRAARQRHFEVAYMTTGLSWRADYVLKLRLAEGRPKPDEKGLPQIHDTADLVGYATVSNHSGIAYQDAQLKLMAGDVRLIREEPAIVLVWVRDRSGGASDVAPQFQEKSFFEYHLYTLTRPTTIASAETKQIELVAGGGIKLLRRYLYDRSRNHRLVRVASELVNSEANGLGKPLPKGVVRLYAPGPDGVQTHVSKTTIDHTPRDEKVRLEWAYAFDLACEARQTAHIRRPGTQDYHEKWKYTLRNHKDYDVTITVHVRVPKATYRFDCDRPWKVPEVGLVEIDVPVKAGAVEEIPLSYRYDHGSGGGLVSPGTRR